MPAGTDLKGKIAVVLINDPDIIFLDEPTTGLDPQARRNFWTLIERIKARDGLEIPLWITQPAARSAACTRAAARRRWQSRATCSRRFPRT